MKALIEVYAEDTPITCAALDLDKEILNALLSARELLQMACSQHASIWSMDLDSYMVSFLHWDIEDILDNERQIGVLEENGMVLLETLELEEDSLFGELEGERCRITQDGVFWCGFSGNCWVETKRVSWETIVEWSLREKKVVTRCPSPT